MPLDRRSAVHQVALRLAALDEYIWQQYPNNTQNKKQVRLLKAAEGIVATVEAAMTSHSWTKP